MDIGKKIAELRIEQGMTQESLARKLAVSRELVSKWELGQRRPDFATIRRIAEAFGIRENHVRSILSKTRKKIKKTIKEKEGERK